MTEHPNLAAALVAALADCSVVDKGRTAIIKTKGEGSYSYEYADLGDVIKLTRPVLAEHGIVVLTPVEEHGNGLKCTVVLLHSSGERLDFGPFPFPHGQTAQATGSMVTYYRRYALVSALGIAAGDDDDGATAQPRQEPKAETTPEHVRRLTGAMNGIKDEAIRIAVKQAFLDQWGKPQDVNADDADDAEMFIADMLAEHDKVAQPGPVMGEQEEAEIPGSAPAPAPPDGPVTKPATNKPSAAARAALNGDPPPPDKPALGARKPVADEDVAAHFPGSEVVNG